MIRLLALLLVMTAGAAMSQPAPGGGAGQPECADSYARERRTKQRVPSDCSQAEARATSLHTQITGGKSAPEERFTAAIVYRGADQKPYICTGVLLDDRHILTAGHCGCGTHYEVTFSQVARSGNHTNDALEIDGNPVLFDPLTCLREPKPGNDLALIRLKEHFHLKNFGDLANLGYPRFLFAADMQDQMKQKDQLKVVGFGETDTGGLAERMTASVPVLTSDCFELPYRLYCAPFLEIILADRSGRQVARDTCGGDSGGPVVVRRDVTLPECSEVIDTNYDLITKTVTQVQNIVVGITSRAAPFTQPLRDGHCGGGGIYTLIGRRSVHAWLDANHVRPQQCVTKIP
jgi:hypothetical protein